MLIDASEGKQCIKSQVEGGDQGKKNNFWETYNYIIVTLLWEPGTRRRGVSTKQGF